MAFFEVLLLFHILAVMVGVGTVTVTDYLHILGIRDPKLEKRSLFVFPHLSNLIRLSLLFVYLTGGVMVFLRPEILESPLFWVKLTLVLLVSVNGFILHHRIFPKIEHGIKNKSYPPKLVKQAAFGGSLSVVSWYGIVVLAITKNLGYTPLHFLLSYIVLVIIAFNVALHMERRRRRRSSS